MNKIKILFLSTLFVGLLFISSFFNLISKENESKTISITSSVSSEKYYHGYYGGFDLISNQENFSSIKSILKNINITKFDYPNLNEIYYLTNEGSCNGQYFEEDNSIVLLSCNQDIVLRNYYIEKKDIELFIFSHELGHYYFNDKKIQELSDDYAHNLSKVGVRIR